MDPTVSLFGGVLAVLLFSCFVKVLTTLNILRFGLSLNGSGFGIVIFLVSFAVSLVIVSPQIDQGGGLTALLNGSAKAAVNYEEQYRPFLEKNADPEYTARLTKLAESVHKGPSASAASGQVAAPPVAVPAANAAPAPAAVPAAKSGSFPVLLCSFLLSELSEAFQLGLMLLIPLIVIDLLVTNVLVLMGVTQISYEVVALPLKLLLFFAVDGWGLITEKIIKTYIG